MKILKKFGKHSKLKSKYYISLPHGKFCPLIKSPSIKDVSIFGFSDCPTTSPLYKSVVKVAYVLAEAGYTIINGGGPGVMRAATEGAKEAGGKVIGITFNHEGMTNFEGRDVRNLFDKEIKTKDYVQRTLTLLKEGEVYVIFQGGTGTVSEFGMAWGLARLYLGHHKPLILYGKQWHKLIKAFRETMQIRSEELKVFKIVETPEEVLEALCEFEQEIAEGKHGHNLKADKHSMDFMI